MCSGRTASGAFGLCIPRPEAPETCAIKGSETSHRTVNEEVGQVTAMQLDEIEAGVGFSLPAEYRRVASEFPFRPIGRDCLYWFYNDPASVIGETLATVSEAGYERAGWQDGYLAIGNSAAGDTYVLDTRADGLPVHCLSHETNAVELLEWPSFQAFVAEWLAAPEECERRLAADSAAASAAQWARMRRGLLTTSAILLGCLTLPWIVWLLVVR